MGLDPRLRRRAWALWTLLVVTLLLCPALVAGPMIAYVLDPELLVLAVLFGTQAGRIELGVLWFRVRTGPQRLRRRFAPRTVRPSHAAPTTPAVRAPRRGPSRGPGGSTRPGRARRASVRPGRTAPSRSPARPR